MSADKTPLIERIEKSSYVRALILGASLLPLLTGALYFFTRYVLESFYAPLGMTLQDAGLDQIGVLSQSAGTALLILAGVGAFVLAVLSCSRVCHEAWIYITTQLFQRDHGWPLLFLIVTVITLANVDIVPIDSPLKSIPLWPLSIFFILLMYGAIVEYCRQNKRLGLLVIWLHQVRAEWFIIAMMLIAALVFTQEVGKNARQISTDLLANSDDDLDLSSLLTLYAYKPDWPMVSILLLDEDPLGLCLPRESDKMAPMYRLLSRSEGTTFLIKYYTEASGAVTDAQVVSYPSDVYGLSITAQDASDYTACDN